MKWTFVVTISACAAFLGCGKDPSGRRESVDRVLPSQPHPHGETPADESGTSKFSAIQKTYGNRTLAEWQRDIKNLDPNNPESYPAIPALMDLMQDTSLPWFTRKQAAVKLAQMGSHANCAVPLLITLFQEEGRHNEATRLWTAKALSLFGPEAAAATPYLAELLHDASQPVLQRQAAVEALAVIGPSHPAAIPALIQMLDDRSGMPDHEFTAQQRYEAMTLRVMAVDGIAVVGARAYSAIPALIKAARSENENLRRKSTAALGAMGTQAEIAIPAMMERLVLDDSAAVRDTAADSLSKIGVDAVAPLQYLLKDADPEVRWRALDSLGKIGRRATPALPEIQAALKDINPLPRIHACEALWEITSDPEFFLSALIEELKNEDREIRMRAFQLLISMGPKAQIAIKPLQQLQKDRRGYVRSLAGKALGKIEAAE